MRKKLSVLTIVVGSVLLFGGSAISGISDFTDKTYLWTESNYNSTLSYKYQFGSLGIFDSDEKPLNVTATPNNSSNTYTLMKDDPNWPNSVAGYYYNSEYVDPSNPLNKLLITATNGSDTLSAYTNFLTDSDQKKIGEAKNLTSSGSLTPTITWSPVADAESYTVRLYNDPNLPNIQTWTLGSNTSFSIEDGILEAGKIYTLKVIANDIDASHTLINRSNTYISLNYGDIQNSEVLINNTTLLNSSQIENEGQITGLGTYLQTDGKTVNSGVIVQESINIQEGSFVANGSITVSDAFYNYGILSGNGVINGNVVNNGYVTPGESPGTLDIIGEYIQSDVGSLAIEIGGNSQGTNFDWLKITGTAKLAGQLDLSLYDGFVPQIGDFFTILTATEGVMGKFDSYSWTTGLHSWAIDYSNINSVNLTYQGKAPVPEPATTILFGIGVTGLAAARRRKKAR